MRVDDMVLVSIDDDAVEPPDLFERHMPAKYRSEAPKLVKNAEGRDQWVFQGGAIGVAGLSAVVSWPKEEWGLDPVDFSEMRPGCYDVDERVRDMDADGMLAGMMFPTFAGFNGSHLAGTLDKSLPETPYGIGLPTENSTVAKLRARAAAAGVDTSETSKAEYRRRYEAALIGA